MKRNILVLLCLGIVLVVPGLVLADCTDLGRATDIYVQDDKTIAYYMQNTPVAQIVLQDCTVTGSSTIRLLKSYVCDSDSIVVDGQECVIMTLKLGSAP